ncbi:unnamed protein product [Owenia fusiformis]|uniref:Glycosyltransferase 2-like domain-containing protein n=1 Tax=Owenia fusiformis TaxID=6347 RepID=A0A8S4PFH0_OWEFU|nr:unnamed protein product [Owenia fusiformis]
MKFHFKFIIAAFCFSQFVYIFLYRAVNLAIKKQNKKQQDMEDDPNSVNNQPSKKQYLPLEDTSHSWTKSLTCEKETGYNIHKNGSIFVSCFNDTIYVTGYDIAQTKPGADCTHSTCKKINHGRQPIMYRYPKHPMLPIEDMVTLVVKTANRLDLVQRLIISVWNLYPKMKCIVIDDYNEDFGKRPDLQSFFQKSSNVMYLQTHVNAGISYGRNLALNLVRTKYVFLTDDDVVLDKNSNITKLVDLVEHTDLTFAGAAYTKPKPYSGALMIRPTHPDPKRRPTLIRNETVELLQYPLIYYERVKCFGHCYVTDIVQNTFVAPLEHLLKIGGWDASIKTQEHIDFFLTVRNIGLKVARCLDVIVYHRPPVVNTLRKERGQNAGIYFEIIKNKWEFSKWLQCKPSVIFKYPNVTLPGDCRQHYNFDNIRYPSWYIKSNATSNTDIDEV